jgi:hypothetical protein
MEKGMVILETQIVQRDWDKRWEKIVKIMDYENSYTYLNESGSKMTLIPERWVTTAVYDYLVEIIDK